ncbi:helix-turn-helix domain-containing protein [Sphingomonas sp.]|uniref:helix-turn-helix domain-containing protein n=1 Tax=Sphingomonas sp. TaxID=28214 RepID=UPI003CC5931C
MGVVELDYVLPSADLQPYISTFYRFHAAVPALDDVERAQIAQLRFRLSPGRCFYEFADGRREDAAPFHLLGPTCGPTRVCVAGPLLVFGVGVTPAGWAALCRSDASAMADHVADAVPLFGDAVTQAAAALRADGGAAAMALAAEPFLRRLLGDGDEGAVRFVRAVDRWLEDAASPELEMLIAATGLSRRQIERRCNALYGCPPKLLARKYRALRAAVALASGGGPIEGFYDQSHMIREVKAFTGLTPRRMREPGELARITIDHRQALGESVGSLVSGT